MKYRKSVFIICFSFVFGIAYSVADHMVATEQLGASILLCIGAGLIYGCIVTAVSKLFVFGESTYSTYFTQSSKRFWGILGGLILIYSVCLFTYFPGVGMNDSLNIMYNGMGMVSQFPVFYCAFIVVLTRIGREMGTMQLSIALYSIIQMLVVCCLSAGIITWFWSRKLYKPLKWGILVYYALEPLMPLYSISMIKDTLFSLLLTVLMIFTYEIVLHTPGTGLKNIFWMGFDVLLLGIVFTRNNGFFIVFPFLMILCILFKKYRRNIYVAVFLVLVGVLLNKAPLKIKGETPLFQESVGIPLQQMAAVVANDGYLTEEQEKFIEQLMPLEEIKNRYYPGSVDNIKWAGDTFDRQFLNEHRYEFLITWLQMMPHNFSTYVKAYLQQTFWFWAPLQRNDVQCFFTIENYTDSAWTPELARENGIYDHPLFPDPVNQILRNYYQMAKCFFNEGVLFWIMSTSALLIFLKYKDLKRLLPYLPGILLWLTLMISTPVNSSLRYVLTFVYSLPCYVGFLFL